MASLLPLPSRLWSHTISLVAALFVVSPVVGAQGVTGAGIRGVVRADPLRSVDARVRVVHEPTGHAVESRAADGRYLILGLEAGGPYTVVVTSVGFIPHRTAGVFLHIGELRFFEVVLKPLAQELQPVSVIAGRTPHAGSAHGGVAHTVPDRFLQSLPTLNRDLYDFVRLVPQISTKVSLPNPALSAVGVGFRYNNFLINGVSEKTLSGNVSNAFSGQRSVPLDAVQEYQVLIAPYDVRYGDFAGAMINTVTKLGTNSFAGSAFAYGRNERLARGRASSAAASYDRVQYGFTLGGPILRDRLHFFLAPELQRFTYPAPGPYAGQPATAERPVPVSEADLARLDRIMQRYGLVAGSAGAVQNGNRLRNLFSRLDLAVPRLNSRAVVWNNFSSGEDFVFSRSAVDTFSLSSTQRTSFPISRTTAVQVHTNLPRQGGGHNELLVSLRSNELRSISPVQQPIVRVAVPSITGGRITLNTGTHEQAHGGGFDVSAFAVKDNLTLSLQSGHVLTLGAEAESFHIVNSGTSGAYGTWTFANLDDLEQGVAERYQNNIDFGSAAIPLRGAQVAAYVADQWQATSRLSITGGVRGDVLAIRGHAPYNATVDSIFGRRTDVMPRRRVEIAPRLGFVWDVNGTGRHQLRGGAGLFAGRYPPAWAHTALTRFGVSGGVLRCGRTPADFGFPPQFEPDFRMAPTACGNGATFPPNQRGDVNLLDRDLRMTRALRSSIAYDVRLDPTAQLSTELVVNRMLSDFVFVNLNLNEPKSVDRNGRVLYGALAPTGVATPSNRSAFNEVIDVVNTRRNRSFQFSTQLEKEFTTRSTGLVSYTYSRARDVQTPLRVNTAGRVAWASARVMAGRHDDYSTTTSANDIPHRVVLAGTYRLPHLSSRTQISFYYVGEAGRPFTYVSGGVGNRGDLNADGALNDPLYVPLNAFDESEIRFSGLSDSAGADSSSAAQATRINAQQDAFESRINGTACLRRQRGAILRRNSCREPWSNTTAASVRHAIAVRGRTLEGQLDVFNVLNLLNSRWGLRREATPVPLQHVRQTTDSVPQPIFRFNTTAPTWTTLPEESAFQLQLAVRYRF